MSSGSNKTRDVTLFFWLAPAYFLPAMFFRVKPSLPPIEIPLNVNHVQPAIRSCRMNATDHITNPWGRFILLDGVADVFEGVAHQGRIELTPVREFRRDFPFMVVAGDLLRPCPGEPRAPIRSQQSWSTHVAITHCHAVASKTPAFCCASSPICHISTPRRRAQATAAFFLC